MASESSAISVCSQNAVQRISSFNPFRLMFGRDCDTFGLLKLVTVSLEDIFEDDISDDGKSVLLILLLWYSFPNQLAFPAEVIQVKLDSTTESTTEPEFSN